MPALDFPTPTADGQVFGNWVWNASKGVWKAKPLTPGQAQVSASAPASPSNGDQWFNTNDGVLYIYYNDGNSSQWVESRSAIISDGYYSPNGLINGAFDIWQRGTSFTTTASTAYTADRWQANAGTAATIITSQQTFTPGTAPVAGYEGRFFARVNRSVAGNTTSYFVQRIEDVRSFAGQTVTFSFWAKAASNYTFSAGDIYSYQNFGTGGSTGVGTTFNNGATTITTSWQRFNFTVAIPSISGKTVGTDSYLEVTFSFPKDTGVFTLDLWGIQLENGSVATPFRRNANSLQGELAACQRYYVRFNGPGAIGITSLYTATGGYIHIPFPVTLRTSPTSLGSSAGNIVSGFYAAGTRTTSSITFSNATQQMMEVLLNYSTSGTVGQAGQAVLASSSWIDVSVEL